MTRPVAGVILAAGSSTRMGSPKALLDAEGATFLGRLAATLRDGGCDPVVAVVADGGDGVAAEARAARALVVVNPGGAGGQIGSLRRALQHLLEAEPKPKALVFTPVDNPRVEAATVSRLISGWRESGKSVVLPRYGTDRGHPVLIDESLFQETLQEDLPEGARSVVRKDGARVLEVAVPDPGIVDDLDTPERYRDRFSRAEDGGLAT